MYGVFAFLKKNLLENLVYKKDLFIFAASFEKMIVVNKYWWWRNNFREIVVLR